MQYRKDIDGLRAIAVLSVVFFHGNENWLPGGFVGVDIFFVISGFLICQIISRELAQDKFSILTFYERRARRILPALFAVIVVSLGLGYWLHLPGDLETLGESAVASSLFLSNFYFMKEVHYFAAPLESYPLLHLWSLAVEEQFYIVTPIVMILLYRYRPSWLVGGLIVLSLISFVMAVGLTAAYPKGAFYMLPSRFWEMGIGAVLGVAALNRPPALVAHIASVVGAVLIFGTILFLHEGPPFPGLLAVPAVVGAALYIWAGPDAVFNRIMSFRLFVWVGLISYSLYLWHWPFLSYAKYVTVVDLTLGQTALAILASFVAAFLSYKFVEQPVRKRGDGLSRGGALSLSVGVIALMSILGGVLVAGKGMPGRWQEASLMAHRGIGAVDEAIRRGCKPVNIPELPYGNTCVVGDQAAAFDFVVWGDSHAGAMRTGFAQLAADTGTNGLVIYKNACSSLLGRRNRSMPFWLNCTEHNLGVLDYLEGSETQTVILVSRWLTAGKTIQFHEGDQVPLVEKVLRLPDTGTFAASVARTIAALEAQDKRIFWLKTVPGQSWHVPSTLAKSADWGRDVPALQRLEDYDAAHAPIDALFAQAGDAVAIPTAQVFCDQGVCAATRDGIALYFDDDHVSQYGATLLSGTIADAIGAD